MYDYGKWLKREMKAQKMPLKIMSDALGIKVPGTIYKIWNGERKLQFEEIKIASRILGVPIPNLAPVNKKRQNSHTEERSSESGDNVITMVRNSPATTRVGLAMTESFSQMGDGHQVDPKNATGSVSKFFSDNMGPNREAWQITTDLIDHTVCKPGCYVVVGVGVEPEPRSIVLAIIRDKSEKPVPVFRVWVGNKLITASVTPSDTPTIAVDDDTVTIRGVVLAHS
jgi:transcriptional regulator with XRE-family HTH domain